MTGWNLPPGCSTRDIDRAAGVDMPCDVCGKFDDACICPECPVCGAFGDPNCYRDEHEVRHGMYRTQEQIDGRAELERQIKEDNEAYDRLAQELEEQEEQP